MIAMHHAFFGAIFGIVFGVVFGVAAHQRRERNALMVAIATLFGFAIGAPILVQLVDFVFG